MLYKRIHHRVPLSPQSSWCILKGIEFAENHLHMTFEERSSQGTNGDRQVYSESSLGRLS